jgi:hypothetical protein
MVLQQQQQQQQLQQHILQLLMDMKKVTQVRPHMVDSRLIAFGGGNSSSNDSSSSIAYSLNGHEEGSTGEAAACLLVGYDTVAATAASQTAATGAKAS